MEHVKYLILGAGPSGLTFGRMLRDLGEDSFYILEKEQEAGGLCRSVEVDSSPFDIGGGHFLDVRRPKVNDFLFRFMPKDEWLYFDRDSRIQTGDCTISHPFEANIWQMDVDRQVSYLKSISQAGCNRGEEMPQRFVEWIRWKLGDKIAEDYMLPYNRKMFADDLNTLGTYWLNKLPNVSFEDTLYSCLEHKPHGTQPGHASFYYPEKYGYGEVWLRIADSMKQHVIYNAAVSTLDLNNRSVTLTDGQSFSGEKVITTIPWTSFSSINGLTKDLCDGIKRLKSSAIETRYVPENLDTQAHWIYIPDPEIPYHRILVRHNFCKDSKGYWVETRKERISLYKDSSDFTYINEYAYPLNTLDKPEIMEKLLTFTSEKNVFGLGRWGEHSHYNSDVVVELAMQKARELV